MWTIHKKRTRMAQASKRDRLLRRLKRELNQTHRLLELALLQRDQARALVRAFIEQAEKSANEQKVSGGETDGVRHDEAVGAEGV